jgi:hypothetical protein
MTGTGTLNLGDGTHATTLNLNTSTGNASSQSSLAVNTNSTLNLFTDSSATATIGSGSTNNGTLGVTGTGSTAIGGVNGSGTLVVGDGTNATVLKFATDSGQSSFGALTIHANSALDIGNNHFFVNYGSGSDPIATVKSEVISGYNGGLWNGAGINSNAAAANSGSYGLGYADSADSGNPAGLATDQIEVAYTLLGDANLDYAVNGVDLGILSANFNHAGSWDQGDFNYDGVVNAVDFFTLLANFNKGASGVAAATDPGDWAAIVAFAQENGLMADLPEPSAIGVATIASCSLLRRRRRAVRQ